MTPKFLFPCDRRRALLGAGTLALAALSAAAGAAPGGKQPARKVTAPPASAPAAAPEFNAEVRPILSRHCFKCHGPDDKQRQAGLRLDSRAAAIAPLASGRPALVPGKPDASEFVRRLFANQDEVMPPVAAHNPLSEGDKQILKRWVAAGAPYRPHWAFEPPVQAPLPPLRDPKLKAWPRNPIDRFVLARLEREGLRPAPMADRYTLIRRVSLDLTGLPPTPEEADAFVHDRSPNAYPKVVDRLLSSPRYGERWARRWLDLARYADTNGYEKDRQRSIWPYRDWVINALNADLPFDQFTIKQLAGDMLPNATLQDRIATGFHRNTMLNEEGGIDPQEYRYYSLVDRVATTGTAWLGLTVGCAQCHTHKFDPINHREYFQFMAFLNNSDEPEIDVPKPVVAMNRAAAQRRLSALEADLPNAFPAAQGLDGATNREQKFAAWLKEAEGKAARWTPLRPIEAGSNLPKLDMLDDDSVISTGDQTKRDIYHLKLKGDLQGVTALRLEALPDERQPKNGPGRVYYEGAFGDTFLSEFTLTQNGNPVAITKATDSYHAGANVAARTIDGGPQTGWSLNGGQGKTHTVVFQLAKPLVAGDTLNAQMLFEFYYPCGLGRFRLSATKDPRTVEAGLPPDVETLLLNPEAKQSAKGQERLREYFYSVAPELKPAREAIAKARAAIPAFSTTLVMQERPTDHPRPTLMRARGEYLRPGEVVEPAMLAVLPPLAADEPRNRLGFAEWLVDRRNPLTSRVTVNRQWAALFGRGIVRTVEDFGYQGDPPTHPELLDWLAVEFPKMGWSMKRLHRLIVTSATYMQSSSATPALLARDPQNRLLARGPRFRMEAELLRDTALAESGLLSGKLGGPSVFPPQPPGVTSEGTYGALEWKVSEGEDRYRRGMYTFSKRSAPYAMFTTFDGPSGETCVARREVSNTPLQALTLLNDAVFLDAARALGKLAAALPGTPEQRATLIFRRCLTRPPTSDELSSLLRFHATQQARLTKGELDAAKLAGSGEGEVKERAAWTLLARAVLNLDEAVTKR